MSVEEILHIILNPPRIYAVADRKGLYFDVVTSTYDLIAKAIHTAMVAKLRGRK
jgi:hypothetical protein